MSPKGIPAVPARWAAHPDAPLRRAEVSPTTNDAEQEHSPRRTRRTAEDCMGVVLCAPLGPLWSICWCTDRLAREAVEVFHLDLQLRPAADPPPRRRQSLQQSLPVSLRHDARVRDHDHAAVRARAD